MQKLSSLWLAAACLLAPILPAPATEYLLWDNHTPASVEDLLQDPLLILRTADRSIPPESALPAAWHRLAHCDFFATSDPHTAIPAIKVHAIPETLPDDGKLEAVGLAAHFDHTRPIFQLATTAQWHEVHWQISAAADFSDVISTLDVIEPYTPSIHLSDLAETFLNSGHTYFFRAQGVSPSTHSDWSPPVTFTVSKPAAPRDVRICTAPTGADELVWKGAESVDTSYLVFGANSIDFVPCLYHPFQIDAMHDNAVTASSLADNLLGETTQTSWPVDDRYAYYRVLAKARTQLSVPSQLVFNSAIQTPQQRNVLCHQAHKLASPAASACRMPFPPAYSWLQERSPEGCAKYVRNTRVSQEVWEQLKDYFLPENHPAKPFLDNIFNKYHLLAARDNLKKAGFDILTSNQKKLIVAKHSKLKGYLIKAFLDEEQNTEWEWWKKRIEGALTIQRSINIHGYQTIMKAPKKWIYLLPPREGVTGPQKQFVLVVEDMQVLKKKEIRKAYYNKVTRSLLNALFVVITENLLIDSIFADNIPFCKDGRIAFVDTEHYNDSTQPIYLWMIARYLSPEMHAYWDQVIIHNRPL